MNNFIFQVSQNDADLILNALGELPARVSMPVIQNLQAQARAQIERNKAQEPATDEEQSNG